MDCDRVRSPCDSISVPSDRFWKESLSAHSECGLHLAVNRIVISSRDGVEVERYNCNRSNFPRQSGFSFEGAVRWREARRPVQRWSRLASVSACPPPLATRRARPRSDAARRSGGRREFVSRMCPWLIFQIPDVVLAFSSMTARVADEFHAATKNSGSTCSFGRATRMNKSGKITPSTSSPISPASPQRCLLPLPRIT